MMLSCSAKVQGCSSLDLGLGGCMCSLRQKGLAWGIKVIVNVNVNVNFQFIFMFSSPCNTITILHTPVYV